MENLPPEMLAVLTGFLSGLLSSIPVGPVNLTILNEGARRGLVWALLIGLGATLMEALYCGLAFTGFASFFSRGIIKRIMELGSIAFLLYLGVRFVRARSIETASKVELRIEEKLHPHSAFMIGFVRVMGNPGVLLYWIVLAAIFARREWVEPTLSSKLSCIAGVAGGTFLWFASLSYAVSCAHRKFTQKTLLRMERFSGFGLIGLALLNAVQIILKL